MKAPSDITQLHVVQPELQADFRRRVTESMQRLVPSNRAFFCFNGHDTATLTRAFGFDAGAVLADARRVYVDERARTLIVFLHEDGILFGVCGLERRDDEAPFDEADTRRMEQLAPFALAGARLQVAYDELVNDVVQLQRRVGAAATIAPVPIAPAPARKIVEDTRLSRREREVAKLLVAGYTVLNISAIMALSEHTVRTYVRRLYEKLEVSNRVDLVREFVTPERQSGTRLRVA